MFCILQAGDSIPWLYLSSAALQPLAKQSHGPDKATGLTDPAAVDELFQQANSSTAWAGVLPTYQVIFISSMAGHTKICATTAQTNQRQGTIDVKKDTQRTNCELQPLSTESQAVTPHSKRTNLPTYQRTIEGPLWSGIYCERHIPTSQSRKPLYPSKPQSPRWHVQGIIGLCEYSTAISERKKERPNK